jgi:oligoendopeptidase F
LYEVYRREGATFVPKYLDLLAAGGSDTPATLLRRFDLDISDPHFWNLGLVPLRDMVADAERLAQEVRLDG